MHRLNNRPCSERSALSDLIAHAKLQKAKNREACQAKVQGEATSTFK